MDYYLSEIRTFGFGLIPKNWMPCNGQLLQIRQNAALFSLLGTQYGGDGVNTFALPNYQGKTMLGYGVNPSYPLGSQGGTETVTLTPPTMPAHNHAFQVSDTLSSQNLGGNDDRLAQISVYTTGGTSQLYAINGYSPTLATPTVLTTNSVASTGGSAPHENRMPYLSMNVCICIAGIFPSRN